MFIKSKIDGNTITMKVIFNIIFLMCIVALCYGQSDTTIIKKNKFLFKWTPTSLIGYSALQFAGEFSYKPQKSFQIEYGMILPGIGLTQGQPDNRGHRIRIEQRNYFGKKKGWYLAPELHFIFVQYNSSQRFSQNWATDSVTGERYALDSYLDNVGMKKYAFSSNLKIGYQYIFKNPKLLFDIYFGLGIRYVITEFTSYPTIGEWMPIGHIGPQQPPKEGSKITPNGVFGIKIGYQIK